MAKGKRGKKRGKKSLRQVAALPPPQSVQFPEVLSSEYQEDLAEYLDASREERREDWTGRPRRADYGTDTPPMMMPPPPMVSLPVMPPPPMMSPPMMPPPPMMSPPMMPDTPPMMSPPMMPPPPMMPDTPTGIETMAEQVGMADFMAEAGEGSFVNDYGSYVNTHADLLNAYRANPRGLSMAEWGEGHYGKYGQGEGRVVPVLQEDGTGVLQEDGTGVGPVLQEDGTGVGLVANLAPMPAQSDNVRVATNYALAGPSPVSGQPQNNPFTREGIISLAGRS